MATFYMTKYALSSGISLVEGKIEGTGAGYVWDGNNCHYVGRDAFDSADAAIANAEKRRVAKIASLRKQITKLEKLSFSTPDTGRK